LLIYSLIEGRAFIGELDEVDLLKLWEFSICITSHSNLCNYEVLCCSFSLYLSLLMLLILDLFPLGDLSCLFRSSSELSESPPLSSWLMLILSSPYFYIFLKNFYAWERV
jgi:hypothetical protein